MGGSEAQSEGFSGGVREVGPEDRNIHVFYIFVCRYALCMYVMYVCIRIM